MANHPIIAIWRAHIAARYARRDPETTPLEIFHTCHGCGHGPCHPVNGLCEACRCMIGELPPFRGDEGTDLLIPFELQRTLAKLTPLPGIVGETIDKPLRLSGTIITELPGLILPAGYERELPKPEYAISYFAWEEMGMAIPDVLPPRPVEPRPDAPWTLGRVSVYDKDLFGGDRRRDGLVCWIRDDLCGVLFDDSGEQETCRTSEVHAIMEGETDGVCDDQGSTS